MTRRVVLCLAAAVLGTATATAFLGACGSTDCSETLTCGGPSGQDGSSDSAPHDETASDRTVDGAFDVFREAPIDERRADDRSVDSPVDTKPDVPNDVANEAAPVCGSGFTCTPAVPAGFQGPVAFVEETASSGDAPAPPACSGSYLLDQVDGFNDPVFSPATCMCKCGGVSGGCSAPQIETFTSNMCNPTNPCATVVGGACASAACSESSQSAVILTPTAPSGGSCTPSVQQSVPGWDSSADWGVTARGCALTGSLGAGCSGTDLCAPSAPSGSTMCVWQAGNVGCTVSYPTKHLIYASGTDNRSCTDGCSCDGATGVSCSETVTVSSDSACSVRTTIISTSCTLYSGGIFATPYVNAVVTPSGGMCPPAGSSTPTGTVTPTSPTTVCCN